MDIVDKLSKVIRFLVDRDYRDYRFVRTLHVFDPAYYFRMLGQDAGQCEDPLWVYFQTSKVQYRCFTASRAAWRQLPDPHPLFDTAFYLHRYFPEGLKRNPFAHYLRVGWKEGLRPSPFFDPEVYRQRSTWRGSEGDPLTHYTHHGDALHISPSLFFDFDWYCQRHPLLKNAERGVIRFYKLEDGAATKSPIPYFDPTYYLSRIADADEAKRDPLSHYLTTADNANGVKPNEWFDPGYYGAEQAEHAEPTAPLAHYLSSGVFERRYTDARIEQLPKKPCISLVVPVYNPNVNDLRSCLRSVLYQAYPHWQLCLVDDNGDDEEVRDILRQWAAMDRRITVIFNRENQGIAAATNRAAAAATGDYIGFLDHDDELTPDCLYHVVRAVNATAARVLYTDEVLIGHDGTRRSVFYKPDFNQSLLFSHNYITHFVVVKTELFNDIGGFNEAYDGAQDYDLILRLAEHDGEIHHIPRVLYRWRASQSSTSFDSGRKPYAHEAGKKALTAAVQRQKVQASVEDTEFNFYYRLRFGQDEAAKPKVTVLLWSPEAGIDDEKYRADIESKTHYPHAEFIMAPPPAGLKRADHHGRTSGGAVVERSGKASIFHDLICRSTGSYVAFLGCGAADISENWLDELLFTLRGNQKTGIVGGRVSYGGTDGPSYTVPDLDNTKSCYFAGFLAAASRHLNGLHCPQQVMMCSWEMCLMSRRDYDDVGGFDYARFPDFLAMHDVSLKMSAIGKKILYNPFATVTLSGADTCIAGDDAEKRGEERGRFQRQWCRDLDAFERYYNTGVLDEYDIDKEAFWTWLAGRDA